MLNVYQPCAVLEETTCAAPHCAVEQQSLLLRNLLEQSAAHEVCLSAFRSVPFRFVSFRFGSSHRQMRRPVFRQHGQIVPCCSTYPSRLVGYSKWLNRCAVPKPAAAVSVHRSVPIRLQRALHCTALHC